MSKFLSVICLFILGAWIYHFDSAAYVEEMESRKEISSEMEEEASEIKEIETNLPPKKVEIPKELPKASPPKIKTQKKVSDRTPSNIPQLIFPLANHSYADVISHYGDPRGGGKRIHEGIDIPAERGTPVLAVADGTIAKVGDKGNAGKQVWLQVGSRQYFYAHLDSYTVGEGDIVKQGDIVGTVGNTGNARHTLPHLHFGVYVGRRKTTNPKALF